MPILHATPSRRFVRTWLTPAAVALAVAVPAVALGAPGRGGDRGAEPAFQSGGYCADAEEQAFLDLLNGYRAQNGLGPVQLSPTLGAAAESHSVEMANNGYFDHTMLGGVSVGENLANNGYPDATYGENIAAGQGSADSVFSQWRNSAGHNANMLSANFDAVGVARAYDPNSGYGWYWTTIYGGTADAPAAGCGEAPAAPEPTAEPTTEPTVEATPEPTTESIATAAPEPTVPPTEIAAEAPVTPLPADAPVPTAVPEAEAAATADLSLRSGPGAGYAALSTVPGGAGLTVTGPAEAGYLPVTADGHFGWVAADSVAFQGVEPPPVAVPSPTAEATVPVGAEATAAAPALAVESTTATPAAAAEPATTPPTPAVAPASISTAATELLLRAGPSSDETVLLVVPAGATLALTGEANGGFLGVSYGGVAGWADAAYLTP